MDAASLQARFGVVFHGLPGALPAWWAEVDGAAWWHIAQQLRAGGARLLSLWGMAQGEGALMSAVYAEQGGLLWLRLPLAAGQGYPDLAPVFPAAARLQRAVADLLGVAASGADDTRPWLDHGLWPPGWRPLRAAGAPPAAAAPARAGPEYPFVAVAGEGVHEIAVGPIHAGIIEPGHFRFSVVGEKVLRLEQRLGYTHKGVDRLFQGQAPAAGYRLAGRISGDSTVAYAWAYAMAAEAASGCAPPPRALALRALLLECERVANHLGDLGALGNDAGLALGLAQFSRLKEDWVRLQARLFGHRYLMDCVQPGGCAADLDGAAAQLLAAHGRLLAAECARLRALYDGHAGLQDRLLGTGRVAPPLAAELGLCGLAGRASAQAWDARCDIDAAPYNALAVRMATHRNGDVAARVALRFEEIEESLRLLGELAAGLPPGAVMAALPAAPQARGLGWVEGWRGPVLVALETDGAGLLRSCHCHDPSWHNWPALQHAIMGNIVPDFPLINKSFNLSYSGHDR